MLTPKFTRTALVLIGLASAGAVSAQTRTWDFTDTTAPGVCTTTGGNATGIGNTRNCFEATQQAPALTSLAITAWSAANAGGNGTFGAGAVINHGTGFGLGVGNAVEGGTSASSSNSDHSMDSANGNGIDALLLSFTTAQVLRTVTLGWSGTDGDFQVLRYTGTGTVSPDARTAATMVGMGGGWELVSTVSGAANITSPDVTYSNLNLSGLSSSYWLITAFNSNFGGSTGDTTADAIKVIGVTSRPNGVPEPGSLALAGLALVGVFASRRKIQSLV